MLDNNMHYLKMLYYMSLSSLALTTPLWTFYDATQLLTFDFVSTGSTGSTGGTCRDYTRSTESTRIGVLEFYGGSIGVL